MGGFSYCRGRAGCRLNRRTGRLEFNGGRGADSHVLDHRQCVGRRSPLTPCRGVLRQGSAGRNQNQMKGCGKVARVLVMLFGLATLAKAEIVFSYRNAAGQPPTSIASLGQISTAPTPVGSSSTITLIAQNAGVGTVTLMTVAIAGSGFNVPATQPVDIPPNSSFALLVGFTPTSGAPVSGSVTLAFRDSDSRAVSYTFLLNGIGLAPLLVTSYILAPNGNQTVVKNNDTITFPATLVGSPANATFVISNQGNGPAQIVSITLSGAAFRTTNLALLPATLTPSATFTFGINFTPAARGDAPGSLQIQFADSTTVSIRLDGRGIAPLLSYEYVTGAETRPISPGGTIQMADTNIGSVATVKIQVRNSGDAPTTTSVISVTGTSFAVSDLPTLPEVLSPGGSYAFTVSFSPKAVGPATATLSIDAVRITIAGTGSGAQFTFASQAGSGLTPVADGGTVVFANTQLGLKTSVVMVITNAGNLSGDVNGISVTGNGFTIPTLPALPAVVKAGDSLQFTVVFAPNVVAPVAGLLSINNTNIALRGIGDAPPALSPVTFAGLAATVLPLQQPAVGLSLDTPYPYDLNGQLTLSVSSDSFVIDPSVQFATGGRTVAFRIPANTRTAVFGSNNAQQVQFQTGSIAGTITVAASFAIGTADVTPAVPPSSAVIVMPAPPQITNLTLGTVSPNTLELLMTGYSTNRSVSQLNLQVTPAGTGSLQTTVLTVNVTAAFSSWYQSASGIAFGSQFMASIPIIVSGPISAVRSISVTAQNSVGTSNTGTVTVQ
ncbi:MAG: choice-of-anchor D domain-containing protein [Candidatus Solibacter sp.]